MFSIIQSHKTQTLLKHLGKSYSKAVNDGQSIFEEFVVLVPSMVLGDWLQKSIATDYGISTMVTSTFWGQYQWQLMQMLLDSYNRKLMSIGRGHEIVRVPEVAVLSSTVMQWRIFAYIVNQLPIILENESHPLHFFIQSIVIKIDSHDKKIDGSNTFNRHQVEQQNEKRLWQVATDFATVFNRYITHRSEWLDLWSTGNSLDIQQLIQEKDILNQKFSGSSIDSGFTPEWLVEHYVELEKAQRYLWELLFSGAYQHRKNIENNFWQAISDQEIIENTCLPKCIYLFTVQQLPLSELEFLGRLSQYIDVKLFHYNPSQMFWADIVDKRWLAHQQIINPGNVYLRDYGHTLLSRLGKQSRETFASLASLSGNEYSESFVLDWQDDFELDISYEVKSLLKRIQYDVLMLDDSTAKGASQQVIQALQEIDRVDDDELEERLATELKDKQIPNDREWFLKSDYTQDTSLQIHSCHSLQRQLEVLRGHIAYWLNAEKNRQLSDIVVLLPDVESNDDLIRSVFVDGVGQDGLHLPVLITGVVDKSIRQLWQAICGYYRLVGAKFSRFEASEVLDWLSLPSMYHSLGLTAEQMARGCDLLLNAGFIRGFDEQHLQKSLDKTDLDYRFSFAYALDKLVLGLAMPKASITDCLYNNKSFEYQDSDSQINKNTIIEKTLPESSINLSDAPIIDALCRVYDSLDHYRQEYHIRKPPSEWIQIIENQVIQPLFAVYSQSKEMRAIFKAMNGFRRSLRANERPNTYYPNSPDTQKDQNQIYDLSLRLEFVLESIEAELESQQISAEPTGVITFARFGSLRTVPYKLVIMLNMNLSEFPRKDKDDRYDLMKAGLSRRGDRSSEDDDSGAFLDALLCAIDNCWIFYNGKSLQDEHEHLPANPVSELLQFLKGEVKWQAEWQQISNYTDIDDIQYGIERYLPKLIENWLVTEHPPLPFSERIFHYDQHIENQIESKNSESIYLLDQLQYELDKRIHTNKQIQQIRIPPAPLWNNVYYQLSRANKINNDVISQVTEPQYQLIAQLITGEHSLHSINGLDAKILTNLSENLPTHLDIMQLVRQVRHPAECFLRKQNIKTFDREDELSRQEPLSLNGLTKYQVKEQLLGQLTNQSDTSLDEIFYSSLLPAGVARHTTIFNEEKEIQLQIDEFIQNLKESNYAHELVSYSDTNNKSTKILTKCHETSKILYIYPFGLEHEIQLKGQVPKSQSNQFGLESTIWISLLPNTAKAKHLLRFWLSHLYWQIARDTTEEQVIYEDGISVWYFNKADRNISSLKDKKILTLKPMTASDARTELNKWIMFAQICEQMPIVLMPEYALIYLDKFYKYVQEAQNNSKSLNENSYLYEPNPLDYKSWISSSFNKDIYDNSSQHSIWKLILGDDIDENKAFSAIRPALVHLAEPIFSRMYWALKSNGEG